MCVPLERWQLPDPLQVAVTELHHVKQSLLLLTAQYTEGLRVKVLQHGQLHQDKAESLFSTHASSELDKETTGHVMDKVFRSYSVPERL